MKAKTNTVKPDFTKNIRLPKAEADYWTTKLENKGFKPPKTANSWIKPLKIFSVKFQNGKYGKIVFNDDSHKGVSVSGYLENEEHIVIDRVMNMNRLLNEWIFQDPKDGKIYRIRLVTPKEKTFAVDVHWDVCKVFKVKATSREEAENKVEKMVDALREGVDLVRLNEEGFEKTDDTEIHCSGEEGADGIIEYFG